MKNILWIVSWYPNHYDNHNGDFIKRHAEALSLYAKVHVLFIHPVNDPHAAYLEEVANSTGNLTEQIIYYRANQSSIVGRIRSRLRYMKLAKYFVKQYIHEHGMPDHVHAHVPIRAGLVALWLKRKYGLPYALTEHYGIYNREVADPFEGRNVFYRNSVKKIIRQAQPFLPVSRKIAEDINRIVLKKNYTVIPNVVNTAYFNFEEEKPQQKKFRFLHVSNMIPLKNVEGIIEAAEKLYMQRKDFELMIAGRHPAHFPDLVKQKNIPVTFTGELAYNEVAQQMKKADAFILFSNTENNPCVLLESLCCGLPVISSRVGGVPEIVNEENGIMVEARNIDQLMAAMNTMLNNNKVYNSKNISAKATELYSYEVIGEEILRRY